MTKGILYYTTNKLNPRIMAAVQAQLRKIGLPIVSVSLEPLEGFGKNVVMNSKEPSILTMYHQIVAGLRHSKTEFVFFCEHDVMYHSSHFEFTPPATEIYYYNTNVWRWAWPEDRFITYDHLVSLSGLCAGRDWLLRHYRRRLELVRARGWEDGRNPKWARVLGHEPGKKRSRGGAWDEPFEEWRSDYPNLDLRHGDNMTPPKMSRDSFVHAPTGWREGNFREVGGWIEGELWSW